MEHYTIVAMADHGNGEAHLTTLPLWSDGSDIMADLRKEARALGARIVGNPIGVFVEQSREEYEVCMAEHSNGQNY